MKPVVRAAGVSGLLLVGGVGLAGCADLSPAERPVPSAAAPTGPTRSQSTPEPTEAPGPSLGPVPATLDRGSAPVGLSVRYVDEKGRFVTVEPQDFPR